MEFLINAREFKESLSKEHIIELVKYLGAERYHERDDSLVFPTVCHNADPHEAKMKLYYYHDTKLFHCYTECGESFDIYELLDRALELRGIEYGFMEIVGTIRKVLSLNNFALTQHQAYKSVKDKYRRRQGARALKQYDKNIMNLFSDYKPVEWLDEGITEETLALYNIKYSISKNKIIIPHYDINSNLVGIRGRALNKEEIAMGNKYMPIEIEGEYYAHPLSLNLYGIDLNRNAIVKTKKAVLFEAEKSVMLMDSYLGEDNFSVATCGNNLNKNQLDILLQLGVNEIIIAFDKEYEKNGTKEGNAYYKKLYDLCKKYSQYCNFSFIYDKEGLLEKKDSPVDKGLETFRKLFNSRIQIRGE